MGPTQRNTGPSWGTIAVALLAGLVVLLLLSAASGVDSDPPVCRAFLYYVVPCEGWVAPSRPSVQLRSSASLRGSGSIGADSRRKPMRLGRLVLGLAVISVLAACGTVALPAEDQPAAAPERPVSIDRAVLSEDRLSVRVEFIGGPEFDRDNPCSVAYQGSAEVVGEELEVNVQALPRPKEWPADPPCRAMGHLRAITIDLDEPFTGSVVRDAAGRVVPMQPPGWPGGDSARQVAGTSCKQDLD